MKPHELAGNIGEGARAPSEAALQQTMFAPGKDAEHPFGVLYHGEWPTLHDGTGRAVRKHAKALAATGLPVLLGSISGMVLDEHGVAQPLHVGVHPSVIAEVGHLRYTSIRTLLPAIRHLVIYSPEQLQSIVLPKGTIHTDPSELLAMRAAVLNSTIVYSVWERDRIDEKTARILQRVAECWVPCDQNASILRAAGVARVQVVPHPYEPTDPLIKLQRRKPMDRKAFYSIGRWEPRKGYHELIGAFLMAYGADSNATLTIKYTGGRWDDYPSPEESIRYWVQRLGVLTAGRVRLIGGVLPPDKILKMHYEHNIYVCSSHGEAWCIPAFDAKLAGNGMVHVPYGGTADFGLVEDIDVPFTMGPAHASYRWPIGTQWADFKIEDLSAALHAIAIPTNYGMSPLFERDYGIAAVGKRMAELVLGVAEREHPKAATYLRSKLRDQ